MLFYSTIYVGDLYKRSLPAATTDEQQSIIDDEATRLGSRALFYSALLSLIMSLVLPVFVAKAAGHPSTNKHSSWWNRMCRVPRGVQVHLVTMWATSQLVFAGCMFATLCVTSLLSITLHSLLDFSFTVSLTVYGGPLSL
jgi:solute carrier family 45 protein 1/2/4